MTDQSVDRLFRKAVLAMRGPTCEACGQVHEPEVHHLITRCHGITRWEVANGMVLGKSCHRWAHDTGFVAAIRKNRPAKDRKLLDSLENKMFWRFLQNQGITGEEYVEIKVRELRAIIKGEI